MFGLDVGRKARSGEARCRVAAGATLLDVRTREELDIGTMGPW
jgi:hypothetical protein